MSKTYACVLVNQPPNIVQPSRMFCHAYFFLPPHALINCSISLSLNTYRMISLTDTHIYNKISSLRFANSFFHRHYHATQSSSSPPPHTHRPLYLSLPVLYLVVYISPYVYISYHYAHLKCMCTCPRYPATEYCPAIGSLYIYRERDHSHHISLSLSLTTVYQA